MRDRHCDLVIILAPNGNTLSTEDETFNSRGESCRPPLRGNQLEHVDIILLLLLLNYFVHPSNNPVGFGPFSTCSYVGCLSLSPYSWFSPQLTVKVNCSPDHHESLIAIPKQRTCATMRITLWLHSAGSVSGLWKYSGPGEDPVPFNKRGSMLYSQ